MSSSRSEQGKPRGHHFWVRSPSFSQGEYFHNGEVVLSNLFDGLYTNLLLFDTKVACAPFFLPLLLSFPQANWIITAKKKKKIYLYLISKTELKLLGSTKTPSSFWGLCALDANCWLLQIGIYGPPIPIHNHCISLHAQCPFGSAKTPLLSYSCHKQ